MHLLIRSFFHGNSNGSPNYLDKFEAEIEIVTSDFRRNIMVDGSCEQAKISLEEQIELMESYIENEENLTSDKQKVKGLLKEAKATLSLIGIIGECWVRRISASDFILANKWIKGDFGIFKNKGTCADIYYFKVGSFVSYFVQNNTPKGFRFSYKWKAGNSGSLGRNHFFIDSFHYGLIISSKKLPKNAELIFSEIECIVD